MSFDFKPDQILLISQSVLGPIVGSLSPWSHFSIAFLRVPVMVVLLLVGLPFESLDTHSQMCSLVHDIVRAEANTAKIKRIFLICFLLGKNGSGVYLRLLVEQRYPGLPRKSYRVGGKSCRSHACTHRSHPERAVLLCQQWFTRRFALF
jgi:hypothetical protein